MASDFNLPYKGVDQNWSFVNWKTTDGRDWGNDIRYGFVGTPRLSFTGENKGVYYFRVNIGTDNSETTYLMIKRVIMNILGYSNAANNKPNLQRVMPLADPDGYGMVADKILSVTYYGTSGISPIKEELYDGDPFVPEFFSPVPFGRSFNLSQRAAVLFNYAIIEVEFCQPLYQVISDQHIGNEKNRFMFTMESPSTEYVQIPRMQVRWFEGPNATPPNDIVADGGTLIRVIQEVTLTWNRVPVDAIKILIPKWKSLLGTVNETAFTLPIYDDSITYEKETMLFMPYRTKPRLAPHGFLEYDVELHWAFRGGQASTTDINWNKFIHPNGEYYYVGWRNGVNNVPLYKRADHDIFWNVN